MKVQKSVDFFLEEEKQYIEKWKNAPLMMTDDDGIVPANINDPCDFLEKNLFHLSHEAINCCEKTKKQLSIYGLTDSEGLMLIAFMGFMSQYFRDDYYGEKGIPQIVKEMQDCLYAAIEKAPQYKGYILYRFCNSNDKVDLKVGDIYTFTHSLTTTQDNWNQECDRYIISPLPHNHTKARCLYEIYNHEEENQVNFPPKTTFKITNINQVGEYRHIYMQEETDK